MSEAITGVTLGLALCKVFGIDPDNVTGIEVKAFVGQVGTVTVHRHAKVDFDMQYLEHFQLTEKSD